MEPRTSDAVVVPAADPGAGRLVARPGLFARLGSPARVTVISAPPGSGKTVLLRSWMSQSGPGRDVAWVPVGPDERDPQRFWLLVVRALRGSARGSALVRRLSTAPELDGWVIVERLLADMASLRDPLWLVIDDVHELSAEAVRQLELLIMRAPPELRFVLAARHDVRLGLHRLRLEGELAEVREPDLRFSVAEAGELFAAAGAELPGAAVAVLHERTEGWAAGLRLAALSLAGHPDPDRFAAGFSGTDRTVAEYLLAEVLDRQSEQVRRLLLRTSILDRVNGELADLLAGGSGGERVLQDLEHAGAFTASLDPARSWFRYHQMFADLLQLELRRTTPGEVTGLHRAACQWFAGHGHPVGAIRHAQAAQEWGVATQLLADHWPGLHLDGQAATIHDLLGGFPPSVRAADAELAAVAAADELTYGSLEAAERHLDMADRGLASVPEVRQAQAQLLFGVARLLLARQRADLPAAVEEALRLEAIAEVPNPAQPGLGEDLRALALISLGSVELRAARFEDADRHLEHGVAVARRIGRPYLEFTGLAYQASAGIYRSFATVAEHGTQAIELAQRHGWTDEPAVGVASVILAGVLVLQGRPAEAEPWVERAERSVRAEAEPAAGLMISAVRADLELAYGRDAEALAALRAAEPLAGLLAAPNPLTTAMRAFQLLIQVRLSDIEGAGQALDGYGDHEFDCGELLIATAALRLAQDDPRAATAALTPVLNGSAPLVWSTWLIQALLLDAVAQDALGDEGAAGRALERALEEAEPDGVLLWFLLNPAPGLLERHARQGTAHAALIAEIRSLLAGNDPAPQRARPRPLQGPLSQTEVRVLRYLPTNLTVPEIANELWVSPNTVKTHVRNLYAKLGTNRRADAVGRARDLGLLAPSALRR